MMNKRIRTHYQNLQIAENASNEVIKGAYKYLSKKHHPDKNPNKEDECRKIQKIINKAYQILSNPNERKKHDNWIKEQRSQQKEESQECSETSNKSHSKTNLGVREYQQISQRKLRKIMSLAPETHYGNYLFFNILQITKYFSMV